MTPAKALILLAEAKELLDEGLSQDEVVRRIHDRAFQMAREGKASQHSNALHQAYMEWIIPPQDPEED